MLYNISTYRTHFKTQIQAFNQIKPKLSSEISCYLETMCYWFLLLLATFGSTGFALGWQHNLSFKNRDFHNLRQPAELLTEFLNLVGVDNKSGATSKVERMVSRPDINGVLLLGPTRRHHQLTITVHLGILVEFRMNVLLPTRHHHLGGPIVAAHCCTVQLNNNTSIK